MSEPTATFDVDVFVALKQAPDSFLVTLEPIYKYLKDKGAVEEKEYLVIEGTPVQFLPPGTPLVEEALTTAVQQEIDDVPVRVFTPEHLAAIALQLGRAKDKARVAQFWHLLAERRSLKSREKTQPDSPFQFHQLLTNAASWRRLRSNSRGWRREWRRCGGWRPTSNATAPPC